VTLFCIHAYLARAVFIGAATCRASWAWAGFWHCHLRPQARQADLLAIQHVCRAPMLIHLIRRRRLARLICSLRSARKRSYFSFTWRDLPLQVGTCKTLEPVLAGAPVLLTGVLHGPMHTKPQMHSKQRKHLPSALDNDQHAIRPFQAIACQCYLGVVNLRDRKCCKGTASPFDSPLDICRSITCLVPPDLSLDHAA
jgi:hypothetical protein